MSDLNVSRRRFLALASAGLAGSLGKPGRGPGFGKNVRDDGRGHRRHHRSSAERRFQRPGAGAEPEHDSRHGRGVHRGEADPRQHQRNHGEHLFLWRRVSEPDHQGKAREHTESSFQEFPARHQCPQCPRPRDGPDQSAYSRLARLPRRKFRQRTPAIHAR